MQILWTANYLCLSSLHMTTSGKQKLVKHHSAVVLEWRRPRAQKEVRLHTLPQLVALYGVQTPQSVAAIYLIERAWTGIFKRCSTSIDVTNSPLVKLGIHLIQHSSVCASCLQWPIYLYLPLATNQGASSAITSTIIFISNLQPWHPQIPGENGLSTKKRMHNACKSLRISTYPSTLHKMVA